MASEKQIEANRRNAQKSTGPTSDAGKNKCRLNAKRDGFTGQVTTLSDEDRPIFENFKTDLTRDLAPKTVMELSLASAIAWDTWRLNHIRAVEMNIFALGANDNCLKTDSDDPSRDPQLRTAMSAAVTFARESKTLSLMSIYEQRMNRSLHKNLATLRQLQAERKANEKQDREEEILLARANDINGLPYQAPTQPSQNGSVFSNNEIYAAANRLTTLQAARTTLYQSEFKVQFAGASSSGASRPSPEPESAGSWPKSDAA
jgi:hypothetical protein